MIGHWRIINIDEYISNLTDFYNDCSQGHFRTANIVDSLNQEERVYLNDKIKLEELVGVKKEFILNTILQDKTKLYFARHLLTSLNIDLDVNAIDSSEKSVFQLLFENLESLNQYIYNYQISTLYKRGYKNINSDDTYLIDFYKNKIQSQQHLELWCYARICYKLNDYDKIEKAFSKEKVIFSILSFKLGKPIGYNYSNLLAVANSAIEHYREQGDLLLLAMKKYKVYDEIKQRDKKGTFKSKEADFYKFKPIQDTAFNEIAFQIFPELVTSFVQ